MITIHMSNTLSFDISGLDREMLNKIKKDFRVINPAYNQEQMMNSKSDDVPKFLNIYEINGTQMEVPRGSSSYLCQWFDEYGYDYDIVDERLSFDSIDFPDVQFPLFKHQRKWTKKALLLTQGTLQSPCGSGKTVAGISLISKCKQPSLVIVPDNELLKQWVGNIYSTLGESIDGRVSVMTSEKIVHNGSQIPHGINDITVTTNQSAYSLINDKNFVNSFGFVMLDECHTVGARTFREVMNSFPAKYRYGLTATPYRNDSLTELIEAYCGTLFYTVTDDDLIECGLVIRPQLVTIDTKFRYDYNPKYARYMYNKILSALESDEKRNKLIVETIAEEVRNKRMVLVIAKRVKHCHVLAKLLKVEFPKRKSIRIAIMAGNDYDFEAASDARSGNMDVIFAVNRANQGLDIKPLETVMMVAPRKAKGEIEQIVGRVMRADSCFGKYKSPMDKEAKVVDFCDRSVPMLYNAYKQRLLVYKNKCIL